TLTYQWKLNGVVQPNDPADVRRFTFTPADNGNYQVTLIVTDKDGGTVTVNQMVAVGNLAPRLQITSDPTTTAADGRVTGLQSLVNDPGTSDGPFVYDWKVTLNGNSLATGSSANFSFAQAGGGTYVATLKVTDKDGTSTTTSTLLLTGSAAGETIHL